MKFESSKAGDLNWASHQRSCLLSSFPWTELFPSSGLSPLTLHLRGPQLPLWFPASALLWQLQCLLSIPSHLTSSIHCTVLGCPWPSPELPHLGSTWASAPLCPRIPHMPGVARHSHLLIWEAQGASETSASSEIGKPLSPLEWGSLSRSPSPGTDVLDDQEDLPSSPDPSPNPAHSRACWAGGTCVHDVRPVPSHPRDSAKCPHRGRVPSSPEVPNTIPYSLLHQLFGGVCSSPGPDLVLGDPETNQLLLSPVQLCPSSSVQLTKCHQPLRAHSSTFRPTKLPDSSQQSQPLPALGQHFPCASHTVPRHG